MPSDHTSADGRAAHMLLLAVVTTQPDPERVIAVLDAMLADVQVAGALSPAGGRGVPDDVRAALARQRAAVQALVLLLRSGQLGMPPDPAEDD